MQLLGGEVGAQLISACHMRHSVAVVLLEQGSCFFPPGAKSGMGPDVGRHGWYHCAHAYGTVIGMSTNLRLSDDAAVALREASRRSGRSQQELLREAVDRYLGLSKGVPTRERALSSGLVRAPSPFRDPAPAIELPDVSTVDLLARDADR